MATDTAARIVDTTVQFRSIEAAQKYARNIKGRVVFFVKIAVTLPTDEDHYFPGSTGLRVSKADFLKVLEDVGRVYVTERGARIVFRIAKSEFSDNTTFVHLR